MFEEWCLETSVLLLLAEFCDTDCMVRDLRYAAAFALRQRMLHFVQTYEHYMMFEVLEPSWHLMEKSLKTVRSVTLSPSIE